MAGGREGMRWKYWNKYFECGASDYTLSELTLDRKLVAAGGTETLLFKILDLPLYILYLNVNPEQLIPALIIEWSLTYEGFCVQEQFHLGTGGIGI